MISEIRPNFFFIERGWLNANHFVFNGKRKILVDTGYINDFEETRRWIEAVGVDLKSIDLVISTHSHCDHIGGNKRIKEISGCQIAIHKIDKQSIDSRDQWATWYRFYDQEAEFFRVDVALEDGEVVCLEDLELRIIHTPGHARGGISLYCAKERFLISSDALWDGDLGVLNTIVEGREAPILARESLDKIRCLDFRTVYPGHGGIISDPEAAIQKCEQKLEDFINNPKKLGKDHLKKILIWVLLMKRGYRTDDFFGYLLRVPWFKAVVDAYFEGRYQDQFSDLLGELMARNIIFIKDGYFQTSVKP
jgi:glyoxylase-like metal-dependent hydrolase (beta-lactamase superfamily II)